MALQPKISRIWFIVPAMKNTLHTMIKAKTVNKAAQYPLWANTNPHTAAVWSVFRIQSFSPGVTYTKTACVIIGSCFIRMVPYDDLQTLKSLLHLLVVFSSLTALWSGLGLGAGVGFALTVRIRVRNCLNDLSHWTWSSVAFNGYLVCFLKTDWAFTKHLQRTVQ